MKRRDLITRRLLLAAFSITPAVAQTCRNADVLLRNGQIVTLDDANRMARSMAIRDGGAETHA